MKVLLLFFGWICFVLGTGQTAREVFYYLKDAEGALSFAIWLRIALAAVWFTAWQLLVF